jgi:hypothetical protein
MRDMSWRLAAMVPALLFGIAMLASLAAGFWFVAAIWLPVALVALWLRHFLLSSGKRRLWWGVLFVGGVACLVLVVEGGLFVLPAVVALLLVDARGGDEASSPA